MKKNLAEAPASPPPPAESATPCRVWIVEDHVSVRQLLEAFVALVPGFSVAGVSASDPAAMEAAQKGNVDLVLLDLMIPGSGGMNALQRFRQLATPPKVLIYSGTTTIHSLQLALANGASGYVDKSDSIEELRAGLLRVAEGGVYFSQGASRLLSSLMRNGPGGALKFEPLELEVLELLARGFTIKGAAHELKLSDQKVYRIRQHLMERANAKSAQDLVRYAFEIGLVGMHREDVTSPTLRGNPEETPQS